MRNTLPAFNSSPENPDTGFLGLALHPEDAEQYCNDSLLVSKWAHFLRVICIAGIFILSGTGSWSQTSPRYNVLFVSIDDLNSRLNFMGMPEVPTPNLQRLVNRGMVFNNSYCQYPLCSPSRTSLLTGWRPDRIGIFTNLVRPRTVLGPNVVFLPEHFKNNGYRIERYGKIMHGLYENDINWDYAEPPEGTVAKASGSESGAATDVSWWVKTIPDAQTNDGALARDLAARLRQTINSPFFFALGLSTHDPFTPNLPYWNKVGDPETQDLLPINNNGLITNVRGNGSDNIILPQTPPGDRNDIPSIAFTKQIVLPEYDWKQAIHAYDGEIAQMDAQLGLVLDELDRQNLWNNTIVVFWSDHGLNLGEHDGAWFKNLLFNETAKVPMIVCVPGKPAGVCSRPVELVDLYPTLAELCGLPVPTDLEGSSFARLLDNPTLPWKRAVFSQVTRGNTMGRSVKTDQYHYNSWGNNGEELYDNLADPYEYTNLVANPAYASVLTQMRTILAEGWTKSLPPACTQYAYYPDNDQDGFGGLSTPVFACEQPTGYVADSSDCDDMNAAIHPGATEICNGIDDNCNGETDEGVQQVFYLDEDNDGYGAYSFPVAACVQPVGYVTNNSDCNDSNPTIYPGAPEICNGIDDNCDGQVDELLPVTYYADTDNDGFGDPNSTILSCDQPQGYITDNTDCDDTNAAVYPGAPEICNGIDDNCDGQVDELLQETYYADTDNDGFGDPNNTILSCEQPQGYVTDNTDCDDTNATVYPGAPEICGNGIDDNCDGQVDELQPVTFYADTDNDGFGDPNNTILSCDQPQGFVTDNTDCNDTNATVYPGAPEICGNGIDDNCDGQVDELQPVTFYADTDNDGFGDPNNTILSCDQPQGFVADNTDCDDTNATVYPGAPEICGNGIDDNCDGQVDELLPVSYYADTDNDGFGDPNNTILSCDQPQGYITDNTDCDDTNATVYPGAPEICGNGIDDNCDGQVDELQPVTFYADTDNDGFGDPNNTILSCDQPQGYITDNTDCDDTNATVYPGAPEICGNGIDDNCDGQVDELQPVTFYADTDNDGFGDPNNTILSCDQPQGYISDNTDCDDTNATVYPGAPEICGNGIDDNCDGQVDELLPVTYYADTDNDGYGDATMPLAACEQPLGYVTDNTDCNDNNPAVYPGALEICNGIDDNCDGQVDEGVQNLFFADLDGDGYGNPLSSVTACSVPAGFVPNNVDCDDNNAAIHPGADEVCGNGIDDNCNGVIDELQPLTFYADTDNDGFGDPNNAIQSCDQPQGYVTDNTDCNDTNPAIYPGALEICNGVDDNCDGQVDEGVQSVFYRDADADGYGNVSVTILACSAPSGYVAVSGDCNDNNAAVRPGAPEVCANGIDDNCNGQVDETTPTAVITPLGNTNICTTGSVILEATAGSGYRYQWRRNNVVITGANKRRYTATTPGNYRVGILNFFTGCSKLSAAVTVRGCSPAAVTSVTGGESIIITQDKPLLYPNPSTGTVQISFSSAMKGTVLLKVSDLSGRTLLSRQANAVQGANNLQLDLRQLANGIYFFELTNNGIPRRIQFVISR